ncbi:MAG: aldehyde ferredoxin oxidoreductase C-terminal domain-containing protein [Firmicutes bacterium]|nr:aldehyde ferredoxin oxidoreductase C-terminal domain-containing protein [Bacillota bacterium]
MIRVMKIGERIYNQTRLFNVREGADRGLDTLPGRLLSEALPDGPARGHVVQLETMLNEYYDIRGWDQKGIPAADTIARLKLK